MVLFVLLVVGAVILGAGAMLAPAWHTLQPRIGTSAILSLAWVSGGAVWWAYAFGWNTLVVDYLLFALLSGVVLGGTLSNAQARAEAEGRTLEDSEQGWTGPQDLLFFALVAALIALALLRLTPIAPLSTPAYQGALALLQADALIIPTMPTAPAFPTLTAYLAGQLEQPMEAVQFGVGGVLLLLVVWGAYDFGGEWRDKSFGRALALGAIMSGSAGLAWLNGEHALLMAIAFTWAFLTYVLRVVRGAWWGDVVGAGLMLGAVIVADAQAGIVAVLTYVLLGGWAWGKGALVRYLGVLGVLAFALAPLALRGSLFVFAPSSAMAVPFFLMSVPLSLLVGVALYYNFYVRLPSSVRAVLYRYAYAGMIGCGLLAAVVVWEWLG
jgi:hypothetical protein